MTLFDRLAAVAEPIRGRILLALERHELTVTELCSVFQLPQSTMSRHLKTLQDAGLLVSRAEGVSRRYSMPEPRLAPEVRQLWQVVREEVGQMPVVEQDVERIRRVLAERRAVSRQFFSTAAGEWDRIRRELVGRRLDLLGLLGLLDERWTVGDLGCGTGQISETLARFVRRVIAVDDSPAMLTAARERLEPYANVEVKRGDLERLPTEDGELDAAVLFLVLQYVAEPAVVIREAARSLRVGGRLLISDLTRHEREEYRNRFGHLWLGFTAVELTGWFEEAGLEDGRTTVLPSDAEAKGPALIVGTARKPPRQD
jgi:SAM-dependent methyltransferase